MLPWSRLATKRQLIFWLGLVLVMVGRLFYYHYTAPQILNQDEAAILLNARLIAEAGLDEWGVAWPLTFRSFGDFKLPGYIYLVAGLGKIIGFTNLTVRLPSLVAGVVLLWLVWRVAAKLTNSPVVGLAAALLLAVSPWSWHYGTLGYEAHLGLVWWLGALWLILTSRRWPAYVLGGLILTLALFTYNAPLILLPILVVAVVCQDWGRWRLFGAKLVVIVAAGLIDSWLTLPATLQKGGIAIFQDPTLLDAYPLYRASWFGLVQTWLGNKYVYFIGIAISHWWQHFSWQFLVMQGGNNPWHTIPQTGHLVFLLPLLLAIGLGTTGRRLYLALVQRRWWVVRREVILLVLFIGSLAPAAITADAPHATRSLFFFVMATVLGARGLVDAQDRYCRSGLPAKLKHVLTLILAGSLILGFTWWWVPATQHWQRSAQARWNIGLETALHDSRIDQAQRVFIVDPNGVLYTLVATTKMVPASVFYQTVKRSPPDTAGLVRVESLDRYEFIFQTSDARAPGLLLQPRSNTQWDIIEL